MSAIFSVLSILMPTVLRFVGLWLDNAAANKKISEEAAANFKTFVDALAKDATVSASLRQTAQSQSDELTKRLAETPNP